MMTAASAYTDRVAAVVLARLRGPKARKDTRHWSDRAVATKAATVLETKRLDADYVVPDTLISDVLDTTRPVALRVARDAAADAAERLGVDVPDTSDAIDGMFAVDETLLVDLVDEALEDMLAGAERHVQGLRKAILTGDSDGLELDELLDRVQYAAEQGGNWLRLNARTIGTALAGKASLEQARALGVTHTQWISRRDGLVRPSHVRADGQVRPVGEPFDIGEMELEYPGDPSGLPATASEVHNCFIAGTPVSAPDVEGSFQAPYVGEVVMLRTAAGRVIEGTLNHPVLTECGWVALGELREGDHVIGACGVESITLGVDPDVEQSPAVIEQVHRALSVFAPAQRVPGGSVNFHGDRPSGEVDVVVPGRLLRVGAHAALSEKVSENDLPRRGEAGQRLAGLRSSDDLRISANSPPCGDMGGGDQSVASGIVEVSPALRQSFRPPPWLYAAAAKAGSDGGPIDPERFAESLLALACPIPADDLGVIESDAKRLGSTTTASAINACLVETLPDQGQGDAQSGADLLERLARAVELDCVIEVERRAFDGHVYTLQTASGMFLASSIPTKNCRCGLLLADVEDEFFTALSTIAAAADAGPDAAGVIDILAAAVIADQFMPIPGAVSGLPLLAAAVVTDTDLVGWRILTGLLEVGPGQQLELPAGTVLGLLAPVELEPDTLAVLIPAGTAVGISGGAVMFPEAVTVLVLAAGAGGIQGRLRGP